MRVASPRRIGIIAGGRSLPREIAESLVGRGAQVVILAIEGEASAALDVFSPVKVNIGELGRIVRTLKQAGCVEVIVVGHVTRPDLASIKPDLGFFRALPTVLRLVRAGGDDAVLRGVIAFFEERGLKIVSPVMVAPELVIDGGAFGALRSRADDAPDIQLGLEVIGKLAVFDIGQAVVVTGGRIETIEAAEGTDGMLDRLTARRHSIMRQGRVGPGDERPRGVLVKRPKPGQDLRVDLPVIGPDTVRRVVGADLGGIAVEAGRVLAAERSELIRLADAHGVFVEGALPTEGAPDAGTETASRPTAAIGRVRQLGRRRIAKADAADILKSGMVIVTLEPYGAGRAVVVVAGHVLAVEAGEGAIPVIERAAILQQWGRRRWRRAGAAVVSVGRDATPDVLERARDAGLAGVAVVLKPFAASVPQSTIELADRLGLFIAAYERGEGEGA
ncbi:MAG: UDP-2,3-diacylglucosamine diphosphatase LpxI [Hyphomicrobiaceae bacterium]|nr:UDP-2,3-diacylglucosamine diphosphatase LpxI [Hyphomicrobiaceae bacterium]